MSKDVIDEFRFFIRAKLPDEAMLEWYRSLDDIDQMKIMAYLQDTISRVILIFGEVLTDVFARAGEAIAAGYGEGIVDDYRTN